MGRSIIAEGKTTNEAIENGLKILKTSKDKVNIKVLEQEDKRSFFSILAPRIVKVEITVKAQFDNVNVQDETTKKEYKDPSTEEIKRAEENVKNFLDELINSLKVEAEYKISTDNRGLIIELNGENTAFLIGYRGETLYSMQNILSSIASKGQEDRIRVILDIEGYKLKREKTLEDLANRMAQRVVKTKKSVTLEPMKAYERKIIHSKLQNDSKVATKSIGEEPRRKIVIYLK